MLSRADLIAMAAEVERRAADLRQLIAAGAHLPPALAGRVVVELSKASCRLVKLADDCAGHKPEGGKLR